MKPEEAVLETARQRSATAPHAHAMRLTLTFVRNTASAWTVLAGHAGPGL